eukprot:34910_1
MCALLWMMLFIQSIYSKKLKYNITYQNISTKCDNQCEQLAQFAICYKRYSTSQTLREANCAIKTSDKLGYRTPYKYFYEIDLAAREMDDSGTLFTVAWTINTISVILALLTICSGVFRTKHNLYV